MRIRVLTLLYYTISKKQNMEEVVKFLKEADVYYLATMDGDQPRVRPFGTAHIFENRLYIQTGKRKMFLEKSIITQR